MIYRLKSKIADYIQYKWVKRHNNQYYLYSYYNCSGKINRMIAFHEGTINELEIMSYRYDIKHLLQCKIRDTVSIWNKF